MNTAILCLTVVSAMGTVTEIMDTAMNISIPMDTLMVMAMDTLMVRIIVMVSTELTSQTILTQCKSAILLKSKKSMMSAGCDHTWY